MAVTFRAVIHSYRTDSEGEAKLTLAIPSSDRDAGNQASQLTKRVLYVTVCEEGEVSGEREGSDD